ncbi:MAG: hypothetical protein SFY80_05280 [Verrucomicrobiota bacterium]|nr:hypothetical protein [Verrucomicrobiota bacterium]
MTQQNFAVAMVKQQANNQKAVLSLVELAVQQGQQYNQQGVVAPMQVGSQLNAQA